MGPHHGCSWLGVAMDEPRDSGAMGSPEDRLKWGLLWLGRAVGKRLQDPEAIADVIQAASLRLVRALDRGVDVRSMEAFLARVAKEEVARYKRDLGRRSRWLSELGEAVERLAAPAHAVAALSMDALMDRLKRLLPPRYAGWLVDRISGATDVELSRRDNVSLAAIRKRWRLLEDRVADSAFLARIFDIPVTKRGAEESLGSGADPSVQPLPPPPSPLPLRQFAEKIMKLYPTAALLFAAIALGASIVPPSTPVACQVQVDVDTETGIGTVVGCSGDACDDGVPCQGPIQVGPGMAWAICVCFTGETPPTVRPRCSALWDGVDYLCESFGCEETEPPIGPLKCERVGWSEKGITHWTGCDCYVVP